MATTQMPTAISIGSWTTATNTGVDAASAPSDAAAASDARPTRGRESEQSSIEHDRLELSGALDHDHRDDNGSRDGGKRHVAGERPQAPGGDRHRRQGEVGRRRGLSDRRDEAERQREERESAAKVISFEPIANGPTGHTPTVLRSSRSGRPPPGGAARSDRGWIGQARGSEWGDRTGLPTRGAVTSCRRRTARLRAGFPGRPRSGGSRPRGWPGRPR